MKNVEFLSAGHSGKYLEWKGNKLKYTVIEYKHDSIGSFQETWTANVLPGAESIQKFPLRNLSPSLLPKSENLKKIEMAGDFADRLIVKASKGEDATIGNYIHQLLCMYRDDSEFQAVIPKIASEYEVTLAADSFMHSARKIYKWLKETYGEPVSILRETPFSFVTDDGHQINGEIDLIYRTNEGDVLVDYKTYSGKVSDIMADEGKFSASKYSGQVEIYREAIGKVGGKICDSLICYFNLGKMIRLIF